MVKARRVPAWKIALGVGAGLLAMALAVGLWIWCLAESRWSQMEKVLQGIEAELRSRDPARPPLRGEGGPGNAWVDYTQAVAIMSGASGSEDALWDYASRKPECDRKRVETILTQHSTALDFLSRGAAQSEAAFPDDRERWERTLGFVAANWLGWLARCQARILEEDGRGREAAELLLDSCQFGRDLWFSGDPPCEGVGAKVFDQAFDQLAGLTTSGNLGSDDFIRIARGLEVLEDAMPPVASSYLREVHERAEGWRSALASGKDVELKSSLWRYGFSHRLAIVDAFHLILSTARAGARLESVPWDQVYREFERINVRWDRSRNPFMDGVMTWDRGMAVTEMRCRIARLRLHRVAARWQATREVLNLADPFGSRLRSTVLSDGIKLWSVGPDGVDDQGDGDPADLVLEVRR